MASSLSRLARFAQNLNTSMMWLNEIAAAPAQSLYAQDETLTGHSALRCAKHYDRQRERYALNGRRILTTTASIFPQTAQTCLRAENSAAFYAPRGAGNLNNWFGGHRFPATHRSCFGID